jgi:hypothetical protein
MKRPWAAIAAVVMAMFALAGCSQTGSTFQNNTGAQITILSPMNIPAGSPDFTLTVTSTGGFVAKTVIQWGGKTLPNTTIVNAATATVVIPAALVTQPGKVFVNTLNPPRNSQDNGLSNALAFTISGKANPVPTVTSITPTTNPACGSPCTNADVAITVTGSSFLPSSSNGPSEVHWTLNGGPVIFLTVNKITTTQIDATISGALLNPAGTAQITVVNPPSFPCSVDCNLFGGGSSASFPFTVRGPLQITTLSLPNAVVGSAYSSTLAAAGGQPPYSSWAVSSGSLPSGLSLKASTGVISGTPTAVTATPPPSVTFKVSDSQSPAVSATASLSLTVAPTLSITTTSLPNASIGTTYSGPLAASGGMAPYRWTLTGGTLPPGLDLNPATGLSGTPSGIPATQPVSLTFKVTDSEVPAASASVTLPLTILPTLKLTTTSLPNGVVGKAYSTTLAATGGITPYSWALTSGTLPAGLSFTAGLISGTPTTATANPVSLTFTLTDSETPVYSTSVTLPLTITSGAAAAAAQETPAISHDGRYVAYTAKQNDHSQILLRDTCLGVAPSANCQPHTRLVSATIEGVPGDADSHSPSISVDGRYVAFSSAAANLVAGSPAGRQVFLRDTCLGVAQGCKPSLQLVSTDSDGALTGTENILPSVSASGRYVAFLSITPSHDSNSKTPAAANSVNSGFRQVFIRDTCAGETNCTPKTTRISLQPGDTAPNSTPPVPGPAVSGSAKHVALADEGTGTFFTHSVPVDDRVSVSATSQP